MTTFQMPPHQLQQDLVSPPPKIDEFIAYENGVLLQNRYLKLANIQDGSYGKVSVALDTWENNRKVAIKSMFKSNKGVSAIARHEISILKKLGSNCENICSLLNHFQTPDYYFLVFEYCSNGDLYDYLKNINNHLNPNFKNGSLIFFKNFIKELINAIKYAHSKGIYHRDIKPENILIDSHGSIKLTDWGLATMQLKSYDPCIGTEKYMSPETFFKKIKNPTHLISYNSIYSDYWSIGITILYTLFGSCPWSKANTVDLNFKKFLSNPEILFKIYPNLTQHGFEIVLSLLQINPENRSIDYCLDLIDGFYNVGLTYDQEIDDTSMDNQFNSSDDSFIFGMDESLPTTTTTSTTPEDSIMKDYIQIPVKPQQQPESQDLPPSLVSNSFPTNFSWADEVDLELPFDIQKLDQNINSFKQSYMNKNQDTGILRNETPKFEFDWC
ncbi:hypothetical protein BN7_3775 [Wickerhamomyces ciferrii]|uniref:non-specific serine/threonine protein kinase n=1 Tax=Wickerhamomyces ciferrii (strain ATCC 14091 / BCRC 22168 / CBS 111 / JCM 3599 / NBRC 0793 / NRRL Y-1031 F-60-10) TaxID=1206466 RepID=K0KMN4_WICCF|nr:uncharacterized protein BN7_3775 [Wickerhamomyces ciferrii]CCH44216.1 hypothetical protein BN7_3775 [Wickerhamomyces ciferrii]